MTARRRRTAEESKAHILEAAETRLRRDGLAGLNITGVAKEAGMTHATVIHHFGSVEAMRDALSAKMVMALVKDMLSALDARKASDEMIQRLFNVLTQGGYATLIAWRAIEGRQGRRDRSQMADRFAGLVSATRDGMRLQDDAEARQLIYLVSCVAIGHGLAGNVLSGMLGMPEDEVDGFASWMDSRLNPDR